MYDSRIGHIFFYSSWKDYPCFAELPFLGDWGSRGSVACVSWSRSVSRAVADRSWSRTVPCNVAASTVQGRSHSSTPFSCAIATVDLTPRDSPPGVVRSDPVFRRLERRYIKVKSQLRSAVMLDDILRTFTIEY